MACRAEQVREEGHWVGTPRKPRRLCCELPMLSRPWGGRLLVLLVLQVLGMAMIIVIIGTAVVSVTVIMFFLIFASGKSTQRAVEQTHPMRLPN